MCGIIGQTGNNIANELPAHLLVHRGPDAKGQWTNRRNCILAHTRLSILDLSDRANQPMTDPSGRFTIVYNGEIYNYRELQQTYLTGEKMRTTSDTEVLLLLWRKMGPECLSLLRGMFAFAIWDDHQNKLCMARDRFGQKPLVYHLKDRNLTFASELNALAHCCPAGEINPEAIDLFLAFQFIPAPFTIYNDAFKLPPAHYAVWDGSELKIERYWQMRFDEQKNANISEDEAVELLDQKIRESVRYRLRADVPVGVLLSGGVDSSIITAMAAQESTSRIQTFSIGFKEEKYNELDYANSVAEKYGTDHHCEVLSVHQAEDYLTRSIAQYGEPFGDSSSLPSLMVCDMAARRLKVVLNGDGGDELLGGYRMFNISRFQKMLGSATPFCYKAAQNIEKLRLTLPRNSFMSRRLRKIRRAISPLHRALGADSNAAGPDRIDLYQKHLIEATEGLREKYMLQLLAETDFTTSVVNQLISLHNRNVFAHDFLVKMDIASMAFGLEARSPFVDHELMELAGTFPSDLKVKRGVGKYILKKMAVKYLPEGLLFRRKRGFGLPVSAWMKDGLNSNFKDLTADKSHPLWDYLQRKTAQKWMTEHEQDRCNHGQRLWIVLVLGLWLSGRRP
ncbi:MAG: asparagine synthase (glutamine-hydrolyzing) [Planctomycetes bacterium]|nr:asparagine synthase (glutamine-hydrolyzing) [Planctomycetota bacterium]